VPALTFRAGSGADGNFAALTETDQTAATRADGWTTAKIAAANMSEFDVGVKQLSTTFTTGAKPASFLTGATANAFKTASNYNGDFAATAWTLTFAVRATLASAQAGRMRVRVFASVNADGSGARELTGSTQIGTTSSALSTTADVTSVVTWTPAATITLNNEYLFFVLAWEITTAGGSNSCDVQIRTGQSAGGTRFVTSNFTATVVTPKSDSDINSGITESAAVNMAAIPATDTDGVNTETVAEIAVLTSADTATVLEATSLITPPPPADSFRMRASTVRGVDTLRGTAALPSEISGSDSGTASEAAIVVARPVGTDANSTLTESVALVARPAATDASGAISETGTPNAVYTGTDASGVISETAGTAVPLAAADAGSAAEAALLVVRPTASDTGGISEAVLLTAPIVSSDNATATESAAVAIAAADAATANEVISYASKVAPSDPGAAVEAASTGILRNGSDGCSATDAASVAAVISGSDVPSPTGEAASIISVLSSAQSGTVSESASVQQTNSLASTDSLGASESVSLAAGVPGGVQTGQGAENASQSAREASSDTGTAQEIGLIRFLPLPLLDLAQSNEQESLHVWATDSDLGTITEDTSIFKAVIEVGISYRMQNALLDVGLGNGRMITVSRSLGSSTLTSVGLESDEAATQGANLGRATLIKVG
jgi:hypothetical protein